MVFASPVYFASSKRNTLQLRRQSKRSDSAKILSARLPSSHSKSFLPSPDSAVLSLLLGGKPAGELVYARASRRTLPLLRPREPLNAAVASRRVREVLGPLEALVKAVEEKQCPLREALLHLIAIFRASLRQPLDERPELLLSLQEKTATALQKELVAAIALPRVKERGIPPSRRVHNVIFHRLVGARMVPEQAMVEGLHTINFSSVKLRVELLCLVLKKALEQELLEKAALRDERQAKKKNRSSVEPLEEVKEEHAIAELLSTSTLLSDFMQHYLGVIQYYSLCQTVNKKPTNASVATATVKRLPRDQIGFSLVREGGEGLVHLSEAAAVLIRHYYALSSWILLVETAAHASPIALSRVTKVEYGPEGTAGSPGKKKALKQGKGTSLGAGMVRVALQRPSKDIPWGLLFTEEGKLLDVDVGMRVESKAQEMHQHLQITSGGATIVSVNGKRLRPAPLEKALTSPTSSGSSSSHSGGKKKPHEANAGEQASYYRYVLETIHEVSQHSRSLELVLHSPLWTPSCLRQRPQELLFYAPKGGRAAFFVLHRSDVQAPWCFSIEEEHQQVVKEESGRLGKQLFWHVPTAQEGGAGGVSFSAAARKFLEAHRGQLGLVAVNGVKVVSGAQAAALLQHARTVQLQVETLPSASRTSRDRQSMARRRGSRGGAAGLTKGVGGLRLTMGSANKKNRVAAGGEKKQPLTAPSTSTAILDPPATPPPVVFPNKVKLLSFTGSEMLLERPSKKSPWGLTVAQYSSSRKENGRLALAKLPLLAEEPKGSKGLPTAVQQFRMQKRWPIESINDKRITSPKEAVKMMSSLTRMVVRFAK